MKKTTKKLNINKETVASFSTLSEKEIVGIYGGGTTDTTSTAISQVVSLCNDCIAIA